MSEPVILKAVQDQYGAVARSGLSNESAAIRSVAQAFGYSEEDLASLPPEANMGLSCGNPIALAGLRRRGRRRPWLRWRPGRLSCCEESRTDWQSDWYRHDAGNDSSRPCGCR